jgi:hypothetical protein
MVNPREELPNLAVSTFDSHSGVTLPGYTADQAIDEVTMSANEMWLRDEVSLEEMLEDPIVHLVMERDGLDKEAVESAFLAAAIRSK